MNPDKRLEELQLTLPDPARVPAGVELPFCWVRVRGNRAYLSGQIALNPDGTIHGNRGKIGSDLTVEEGYESARLAALAMLASIKRELGSLDRVNVWLKVLGMVNTAPDFNLTPAVVNGFSDLILDVYGKERGDHSRSAVGMANLPFGAAVEIEAEVEIKE